MAAAKSSEKFSGQLSNILNVMGYSYKQIKNSQGMAGQLQQYLDREYFADFSVFIAGSKKEGLSFLELNSDIDLMFIFNKVMCYPRDSKDRRSRSNGSSYVLDFEDTPPGYAMLVVDELSNDTNTSLQIHSSKTSKIYFSSEKLSGVMSVLTKGELQLDKGPIEYGPSTRKPDISQLGKYTDILSSFKMESRDDRTGRKETPDMEREQIIYDRRGKLEELIIEGPTDKEENTTLRDSSSRYSSTENANTKAKSKTSDSRSDCNMGRGEIIYNRRRKVEEFTIEGPTDKHVSIKEQLTSTPPEDKQSTLRGNTLFRQQKEEPSAQRISNASSDVNQHESLIQSIDRAGPSQATQYKQPLGTFISQDNVIAFPALCSDYMQDWCTRKRYQGFPSGDQIDKISKMDAHVVPVGYKKSENAEIQWRVCFTFGEVELLQSLNGTQYKLYVLLKYLSKNAIKPICPGVITSYVMKNVVLWLAELKPLSYFTDDNIENCLVEAVHFLMACVQHGYIPNYMIHTRNLIQDKMSVRRERKLYALLKTLFSERGSMVMRCEKIRLHMASPYMENFSRLTDDFSNTCTDIFQMFNQPDTMSPLTGMESVFDVIMTSIERSIAGKSMMIKFQSMVVLKYIDNWITELPKRSPERVKTRSNLRQKCTDLKKQISVAFALDLSCDPAYKSLIKMVASFKVDPSRLSSEALDSFLGSERFVNDLAEVMLKTSDYLGAIDEKKIGELLVNPMQMMQTFTGATRVSEVQRKKRKEYADIDLD